MTNPLLEGLTDLDRIPPGLRFRLKETLDLLLSDARDLLEPSSLLLHRLDTLFNEAEPWVGLEAELACVGYTLLEGDFHPEIRRWACVWLTLFPSVETARRLSNVALSSETQTNVREQAVWSLGYRQAGLQPASVCWQDDAIQEADSTLVKLARQESSNKRLGLEQLPLALRHLESPALFEVLEQAPLLWGQAYEAFLSPGLAKTLLLRLEDVPEAHTLRTLRVAAATLGVEALPILRRKADYAELDEKLELLFLALTFGGEKELDAIEEALRPLQRTDLLRQRARWHLSHPGVVPTVRALRAARRTGRMQGDERRQLCAQAADDFAALTPYGHYPEAYVYEVWERVVLGSRNPGQARALCAAHPESQQALARLYLEDLAARGRVEQVAAAAERLRSVETGAFWLAVYGRPFASLRLAATSRLRTPEVVAAQALALYRAGRPDLAKRVVLEELPPPEVVGEHPLSLFPGDHEKWLAARFPEQEPAVTALVRGLPAIVDLAAEAPLGAAPDTFDFQAIAALERHLARPIEGALVFLAGEFDPASRDRYAQALRDKGGRLVSGPFPGTHYYVLGRICSAKTVAQLERQGARRLHDSELGISW